MHRVVARQDVVNQRRGLCTARKLDSALAYGLIYAKNIGLCFINFWSWIHGRASLKCECNMHIILSDNIHR